MQNFKKTILLHARTHAHTDMPTAGKTKNKHYTSALETFVIIALYKSTFTIPYHTMKVGGVAQW